MTDNAPAAGAPDEGLRAEVAKIMAEPGWGTDPALEAKVAKLYQDRYGSGTVELTEGVSTGGPATPAAGEISEDPEAAARAEFILAPLKQAWGPDFDARFAAAGVEARTLFTDEAGVVQAEHFADLGARIREHYGPKGETLAIKFLAELAQLRKEG